MIVIACQKKTKALLILQELELIPKPEEPQKRRAGRPKGSKNKTTTVEQSSLPEQGKRKRGRPKGSKNKPKQETNPAGDS